jgi:hypothetical protein
MGNVVRGLWGHPNLASSLTSYSRAIDAAYSAGQETGRAEALSIVHAHGATEPETPRFKLVLVPHWIRLPRESLKRPREVDGDRHAKARTCARAQETAEHNELYVFNPPPTENIEAEYRVHTELSNNDLDGNDVNIQSHDICGTSAFDDGSRLPSNSGDPSLLIPQHNNVSDDVTDTEQPN